MDVLRRGVPTRFTAQTKDSGSGEPGDPRELTFAIGRAGTPMTTYELSRGTVKQAGPGDFYVELRLMKPGEYSYRWRAFGATVTQQEVRVRVE